MEICRFQAKICRFHAEIHGFWGFFSFYTQKSIQRSVDFSKICNFQTNCFLDVVLLKVERKMKIFFQFWWKSVDFKPKSVDFQDFPVSTPNSVQKSVDFTWNPRISQTLHTWAFSFASSKVFLNERPMSNGFSGILGEYGSLTAERSKFDTLEKLLFHEKHKNKAFLPRSH